MSVSAHDSMLVPSSPQGSEPDPEQGVEQSMDAGSARTALLDSASIESASIDSAPLDDEPESAEAGSTFAEDLRDLFAAFRRWPLGTQISLLALVAIYAPVVYEVSEIWRKDDTFAHGFLVLPICLFLVWLNRTGIRQAIARPTYAGLPFVAFGLALETAGYLLHVKLVAMFSLIPTLIGVILMLHGPALWRQMKFAVSFLFFAVPLPDFIFGPASNWIQSISSTGAALTMKVLGYSILQTGNLIEIPGMTLEVAEVCSGFKKLIALFAFSLLYGYMFQIPNWKRAVLFLAAAPIAVFANVVRIAGLIAVSDAWGEKGLNIAHDWAEMFVLVVAFFMYVLLGKALGCKKLRFLAA